MFSRVDVIDADVHSRAMVARALVARGFHAEIYEDFDEFAACGVRHRIIFAADKPEFPLVALIAQIREELSGIAPIVGYAEDPSTAAVVRAMRAGASDYLTTPFRAEALDGLFRRLANGPDQALRREILRYRAKAKVRKLTRRETDVLSHLARGRSNKEIGQALGLSPRTVEIHRANMISRLGAHSAADAVRIAVRAGLDEDTSGPDLLLVA